ncbi:MULTISPECIES: phenylalanine 4-monooxygenase [Gammaproteobacteria]|uniref:phenylalanine 4-monooxygenase n=1 Tax=Gammaproteobacteria TaxID=1236 RepID=UPI001F32BB7D|nr:MULTISPECIES: phenylalanine 4-monooxygenase [Gammaproteobacteria]MDP4944925.1 phenylalanine 4-monooxygenase [Alishewanella sp.]MDP5206816.1 phenylalanine 4-monooxygenase [Alishewanella sp. SMS9]MCF4008003.1 phenylalanine 4-monooxygenase [Rheinheimera sp. UJ63]MDP5037035.1 phenylalanine 4-monooxygenase [Alishewanella sp.]MDP5187707.1 phenylalanine 4-monooxygenase [Alishewanella sp.]
MTKTSKYQSRQSDDQGIIHWSAEENQIWHELITRQLSVIEGKACAEYMAGLEKLQLPQDRIPQLEEVSQVLRECTGWECAEVPALISFDKFFELLANKRFPVATFIRSREEFDYLQEPDIFHEIFGHCAMLTNPAFAEFTHTYGKLGLAASKQDRVYLARLYWFTIEFGLLNTADGLRIYGGGILSSPGETQYALGSDIPERKVFDAVDVLRTPYRIDIMQPIYFMINSIDDLFDISQLDMMQLVNQARALGLHAPKFPPKEKQAS